MTAWGDWLLRHTIYSRQISEVNGDLTYSRWSLAVNSYIGGGAASTHKTRYLWIRSEMETPSVTTHHMSHAASTQFPHSMSSRGVSTDIRTYCERSRHSLKYLPFKGLTKRFHRVVFKMSENPFFGGSKMVLWIFHPEEDSPREIFGSWILFYAEEFLTCSFRAWAPGATNKCFQSLCLHSPYIQIVNNMHEASNGVDWSGRTLLWFLKSRATEISKKKLDS